MVPCLSTMTTLYILEFPSLPMELLFVGVNFDPDAPDHQQRLDNSYINFAGERHIHNFFHVILPKACLFTL